MTKKLGRVLLATVITAAAVVSAACGGDGRSDELAAGVGPEHVHGLGVNPADGALFIATHTGLFTMPLGSPDSARVGDRLQDTMGFAVRGPDRFIGSGHPDLRDDLPPFLGLIESSDAGRSWEPVSLLGDADFHTLRVSGSRVVGYDAVNARVLASDDEGRTWRSIPTPAELSDLVLDPRDPDRIVAASGAGVITTSDGGATWERLLTNAYLLAWPAGEALYGIGAGGEVTVSRDGGETWDRTGDLEGEPAAVTAAARDTLIVALHDGRMVNSTDAGATWSDGAWPPSS